MRYGIMTGADGRRHTLDDMIAFGRKVEAAGFDDLWMANVRSHDALMTLTYIARATARIRVGTAVTPTPPRHPSALARRAIASRSASALRTRSSSKTSSACRSRSRRATHANICRY
jgi:alkanesulfonate monooxygenase SsuD/methylene tetrahydromethanopterin reductase-like flavin-dependent oxidoreductase (luciferase family)